jgi:hypothetical protein
MAKSIFEHQSTTVPENQTVNDVVVVGGDVTILGTVNSSVIVVNGDAHIQSSAHIKGFVLIIGGKLQQDPGAEIADDVINISFDDATKNSLFIGGGLVVGLWVIQLAGSLIMLLIPILMTLFGKKRMALFINKYKAVSAARMLYTGFFSGLLIVAACMLLLLTVIGIPLILVLGLLVLVTFVYGITILSHLVGERFQGSTAKGEWMKAAIGAFILMASVNIPFVGMLILLVITLFSLGITTTWVVAKAKKKKQS